MARRKPILHCDAHVLERAKMTNSEFEKIAIETKNVVNRAAAKRAAERQLGEAFAEAISSTPTSNTGGYKENPIQLTLENGTIKEVLPRKHYANDIAFIDWLNFTVHESTYEILTNPISDNQVILGVSAVCESLFGFGITNKRERGANFYHLSYDLGDSYGLVCFGGQRNTILVMLNGEGCAAARAGWELRVHDFLETAQNPKITRIDLAHDDIEGHFFNAELLEKAYDNESFKCGQKNPDIELRGNWKNPTGKGRTINVGRRSSGKFFRGYEKGCQLGAPLSKWFRCEVEFKAIDRVIPLDILRYPQEYFAASYPIFNNLNHTQQRILTTQKTVEFSYARTKDWLTKQCGSALNLINEVEGQEGIKDLFKDGKLPKGVVFPTFLNSTTPIHLDNQEK